MKTARIFHLKVFIFDGKFSICLNRRVFVMKIYPFPLSPISLDTDHICYGLCIALGSAEVWIVSVFRNAIFRIGTPWYLIIQTSLWVVVSWDVLHRNHWLFCTVRIIIQYSMTIKVPSKFAADDNSHFFFKLFFRENKTWHCMWIVCQEDNSHMMSNLIY